MFASLYKDAFLREINCAFRYHRVNFAKFNAAIYREKPHYSKFNDSSG